MKYLILLFYLLGFIHSYAGDTSFLAIYTCKIDYLKQYREPNFYGHLLFNSDSSSYFQNINQQFKIVRGENTVLTKGPKRDTFYCCYKNFRKNMQVCTDEFSLSETYSKYLSDSIELFNWNILYDSTKYIYGYNCIKAITSFRGRIWEAWFASDIPTSNGPWKFGGLPGLIFEVYDTDQEISFKLESFKKVAQAIFPQPNAYMSFQTHFQKTRLKLMKIIKAMESSDDVDPNCKECSSAKYKFYSIEQYNAPGF